MGLGLAQSDPISVLIVDDSRSIRRWLRSVLNADDRLNVVAEAGSGREARDVLRTTKVDVMTLDVDMPGITGLDFLARLMKHRPMPVVMFSALTKEGSRVAVEALSLGAVDCIGKPRSAFAPALVQDICERIWLASQARISQTEQRRARHLEQRHIQSGIPWRGPVILLGASTGGVAALETVLFELENNPAPVIIAQHMPDNFLRSFCRRLNEQFSRHFCVATEGMIVKEFQAIICTGLTHSTQLLTHADGSIGCTFARPSTRSKYHPSIDDMFVSAAQAGLAGGAALLTGMGVDGANGLLTCKSAGFTTWAQDEDSSVVYGMPKAAIELMAADHIAPPQEIGLGLDQELKIQISQKAIY